MTITSTPLRQLTDVERFPESRGPGIDTESGAVLYGQPGNPRIGPIPHPSGFGPEEMWAERARLEAEQAAIPPEVRAARELILEEMRTGRRARF